MRRDHFVWILLLFLFLVGCKAAPTPAPVSAATEEPAPAPVSPTMETVDYCVSCHTDKEQLISTAKPVETAEGESKGVG